MDVSTARAARGARKWRPLCWYLPLVASCRSAPSQVELPAEVSPESCHERILPPLLIEPVNTATKPETLPAIAEDATALTLNSAIDYGLRNNPRLRQAAARVEATRAGETVAFAPFLPELGTSYRYSGFNVPVLPGGTFVPASLNTGAYGFSLAEAGVQWTLYDFGRTAGRYGQAVSQTRVDELTLLRARQTIASKWRGPRFGFYPPRPLCVREQAVQQAESILRDTRTRRENGVADREAVLRARWRCPRPRKSEWPHSRAFWTPSRY